MLGWDWASVLRDNSGLLSSLKEGRISPGNGDISQETKVPGQSDFRRGQAPTARRIEDGEVRLCEAGRGSQQAGAQSTVVPGAHSLVSMWNLSLRRPVRWGQPHFPAEEVNSQRGSVTRPVPQS